MIITNLRGCLLRNPLGIDAATPELSWEFEEPEPGSSRQAAWRVCVASRADRLDSPDLWDSGRVENSRTAFIAYGGLPLTSRMECHWRVEAWDESGNRLVSAPAFWTMGLLSRSDWSAHWIGLDAATENPKPWFGSAQWIWSADTKPAAWTFETAFEIEPSELEALREPLLEVLADDEAEVFLNGRPICRAPRARAKLNLYPGQIPFWIPKEAFLAGTNSLRIEARKRPGIDHIGKADAAGVIARLLLTFDGGLADREIATGSGWACRSVDGAEATPVLLGSYGVSPWHLVTPEDYPNLRARYLRHEVDLPEAPVKATLYLCGLGLSEAYINGSKAGNDVLSPSLTDYDRRAFYRTHDVTGLLKKGVNALGALLGNGRFFAPRNRIPIPMTTYGCPKMLWQLEISLPDGSVRTVTSTPEWRITAEGPLGWNNEFDGEQYDDRMDFSGWSEPGFDDSAWKASAVVAPPGGILQSQMAEPIRVTNRIEPVSRHVTKYGSTIFDFGQNIAGWCHVRASGPGTRLRLRHAESLDNPDALFTDNLRSALCCDTIHLGSRPLDYEPRFALHGFRYVEVREELCPAESIELAACFVHDDVRVEGEFRCSDETMNGIFHAARRGILGNYRSMPMDCPQRDERMGWLGDRAAGSAGEMYLFDVATFYRKWMDDIREAQLPNGCIPDVAPPYWRLYNDNVTWPACLTFIPNWLHLHYGDTATITRTYPAIRRWIDHMLEMVNDGLITRDIYGDWCVPPESQDLIHSEDPQRKTSGALLSSCFMVKILEQGKKFAGISGNPDDARRWNIAADGMRDAINRHFLHTGDACYDTGSQTASLIPLAFGIVPPDLRDKVFDRLVSGILESGEPVIGTGLIGIQCLMRTLTACGRADLACEIASRTTYPSWGYMLKNGATTIWELWNGNTADPAMNSGNHVMLLGDLIPWMFADLAGMQPDEPGFSRIFLRPVFPEKLKFVEASFHAMPGEVRSAWEREGAAIVWTFSIPANTFATAQLEVDGAAPEASTALSSNLDGFQWSATFGPGAHTVRILQSPLPGRADFQGTQSTRCQEESVFAMRDAD